MNFRRAIPVFALASGLAFALGVRAAAETGLRGLLLGLTGGSVDVDMDVTHELLPGEIGILKRGGARLASVEVVRVDGDNVFLRALDIPEGFAPGADDTVFFTDVKRPAPAGPRAGAGLGGEDLVPLLTPLPLPKAKPIAAGKPSYRASMRAHGRVTARQFYQAVTPSGSNQRITRIDTDGALESIGGSLWAFTWSGNGSYLDGNRRSVSDDFRRFRPRARRLLLSRPLGGQGFFHAGRFFPRELPGLGTVDGLAVEAPAAWLKLGAVAGTRPDRRFQEFSSRELIGSIYASADSGTPGQGSYSATLGVMHTRWLGKADELAALLDQNFDLGPALSVYQTAQLDFNAGAAAVHKGVRLTRLDLSLNSGVNSWLVLRGGLSHFEPVDVAAERAFIGGDAPFDIDNGYWRFWAGGGQTLPWNLGLDEEISWTRTEGRLQPGLWRATLWRQGLPGLGDARAYLTGYNLAGADYGGSAGTAVPLPGGKFLLDANAGFNYARGAAGVRRLELGDAAVRLEWRPGRTWQLDASAAKVWRGSIKSSNLSGGVTFRW